LENFEEPPEHAVGPGLLADLKKLVANFVDGLVPADAGPFPVDELGWILQAALAMSKFARSGETP
jgi:hypothetical protein